MCQHEIQTKIEGGYIISYCAKCGAILDSKPVNNSASVLWNEAGIKDNGGQILHD